MTQTSGRYANLDGQPVVRFERTFPHSVDAVWEAISDPRQLEAWFPTTVEFETLAPGSSITFRFAQDSPDEKYPPMSGEFLEVDPPRRLAFSWGEDRLTFELADTDDGDACRLVFTVALDSEDKAARDSAGWESCLDMLARVAGGEAPQRPGPSDNWQRYYDEYKRLGLPATAEIPG
jgi:uncharacterized protein YndB with AHSA1/START domain